MTNTKALISCTVMAYAKGVFSHDAAHTMSGMLQHPGIVSFIYVTDFQKHVAVLSCNWVDSNTLGLNICKT